MMVSAYEHAYSYVCYTVCRFDDGWYGSTIPKGK